MPPSVGRPVAPPKPLEAGHRISEKYVLGREIGKGAFGTVYECQNQETGEILAVKRVALRNLSPEQLKGLEQEVEVLKMLHHPNIVKYIATVRTRNHFHIVLQFMENGSLEQNLKKFGIFSPALVSLFARQVLQGLAYLHDQGVIHRDIKGANILADKTGRVKLADFGVAVLSATKGGIVNNGDTVVGTPYWMAPEIIEMLAPTSACDIWSVGCTVIELLTSKPPYYDVPPYAALYRIVQDETVPIPNNLPEEVLEFLHLCFQKQPTQRPTAQELLENEWIRSSISMGVSQDQMLLPPVISREFDSQDDPDNPATHVSAQSAGPIFVGNPSQSRSKKASTTSNNSASSYGSNPIKPRHSLPGQVYDAISTEQDQNFPAIADRGSWRSSLVPALSAVGENDHEDWDLEMGLRDSKPPPHAWAGPPQLVQATEMTRPHSMRGLEQMAQTRAVKGSPAIPINEKNRTSSFLLSTAGKSAQIESQGELEKAFEGDRELNGPSARLGGSAAERKQKGMRLARFRENAVDADFGDISVTDSLLEKRREEIEKDHIIQLSLDDNETGRSLRGKRAQEVQELVSILKPENIGSNKIVETCEKLVQVFRDAPALKRTLLTHHGVTPILETLSKAEELETRSILRVLIEVSDTDRAFQELLIMAGIVPTITRLVGKDSTLETRKIAATLISHFLCTSPLTLHMFVACGGLDAIVALLDTKGESTPIIELSIIGVDGVQRVFAETVAPHGSHRRASMARAAAEAEARGNGIGGVPKNDFCLLFAKTMLLERLAALGHRLQEEDGKKEALRFGVAPVGVLAEVCHIFSIFSLGGPAAKKHLSSCPKALRFIFTTITTRWAAAAGSNEQVWEDDVDDEIDTVRTLLHCIKNLSSESSCLDDLDAAGAVQSIVPFLSVREAPQTNDSSVNKKLRKRRQIPAIATAVSEVHNLAMLILFYLLRLNPTRQERAAVCGIIPYCKSAVQDRTTVKTFAMQILVDLAHASDFTRHCLYKDGALDFFLESLVQPDPFWQERALLAIQQFLFPTSPLSSSSASNPKTSYVNSEIERSLLRPSSLRKFIALFQSAQSEYFESVVKIFMSMLESSTKLAEAIGRTGVFVSEITSRLSYPKAEVRINLLKLLAIVANTHSDLQDLLLEHNLPAIVTSVHRAAKNSKFVIVSTFAEQLLNSWKPVIDLTNSN